MRTWILFHLLSRTVCWHLYILSNPGRFELENINVAGGQSRDDLISDLTDSPSVIGRVHMLLSHLLPRSWHPLSNPGSFELENINVAGDHLRDEAISDQGQTK